MKVVQRMLGHADATMTLNTYADLWPDRLDDVTTAVTLQRSLALADPITTDGPGHSADPENHDGIMTAAPPDMSQAPEFGA